MASRSPSQPEGFNDSILIFAALEHKMQCVFYKSNITSLGGFRHLPTRENRSARAAFCSGAVMPALQELPTKLGVRLRGKSSTTLFYTD